MMNIQTNQKKTERVAHRETAQSSPEMSLDGLHVLERGVAESPGAAVSCPQRTAFLLTLKRPLTSHEAPVQTAGTGVLVPNSSLQVSLSQLALRIYSPAFSLCLVAFSACVSVPFFGFDPRL